MSLTLNTTPVTFAQVGNPLIYQVLTKEYTDSAFYVEVAVGPTPSRVLLTIFGSVLNFTPSIGKLIYVESADGSLGGLYTITQTSTSGPDTYIRFDNTMGLAPGSYITATYWNVWQFKPLYRLQISILHNGAVIDTQFATPNYKGIVNFDVSNVIKAFMNPDCFINYSYPETQAAPLSREDNLLYSFSAKIGELWTGQAYTNEIDNSSNIIYGVWSVSQIFTNILNTSQGYKGAVLWMSNLINRFSFLWADDLTSKNLIIGYQFNLNFINKLVKFDSANSRYTVKHGAYFDLLVIQYAINA